MDGSPSSIVMGGFGNGTFAGSPSLVVTMGFGVGDAVITDDPEIAQTWIELYRGTTWEE